MTEEPTRSLPPDSFAKQALAAARAAQGSAPTERIEAPDASPASPPPVSAETTVFARRDTDAPDARPEMAATLDGPVLQPGQTLPFRRHFGDYELLEEVARGGMGVVFKARQKSLNRIVALKMILAGQLASPEQVRRFHTEAEEAGSLDHSNIVPIYQVSEEEGQHYFTMKLIEGGNLAHRLKGEPMPPREAVQLVATIARAVHYAHQRGILHRDLKPGNILLDERGEPHVTDFGLAKHLGGPGGQAGEHASTQSGAVVGTPSYMAPEQAAASKTLSVAVDVYSLGAILFEMLTGRPPFQAANPIDTILQVMEKDPPRPRSLNPRLDRDLETITLKCLEKDPAHRYGSALRLAEDLERYVGNVPIQARPATVVERTVKWARRRPAAAALVAVVGVAGLLFLAFGWWTNLQLKLALDQTEKERAEVVRQRQDAAHQRDLAQQNLQKRLDIIDDFLVRMDDRLQRQGVPSPVRMEFLHDALQLSQGVLQDDPTNLNARRQLGRLHFRMADMYRLSRLFPEAEQNFASALTLQRKLAGEDPADLDSRHDLAVTLARHARLLQERKRFDEALQAVDEAIRLEDDLTAREPTQPRYPEYAAYYRYRRADLLEAAGRRIEAVKGYQDALSQQEGLVAAHPATAVLHTDLAATAGSLAALLTASNRESAIPYRQRVIQARRQLMSLTRNDRQAKANLVEAYYDLVALLRQCDKHEDLAKLGAALRADLPDDSGGSYDAACFTANAAETVRACKHVPEPERQRLAAHYTDQAIKLLSKAVHEGYRNHAHMAKDSDLDPLRARKDYQELVGGLEQRYPTPPQNPAQELEALQTEFQNARANYDRLRNRAETVAEKKKAEAKQPRFAEFAERSMQLAQKHRDSTAAVDALVWVLESTVPEPDTEMPAATAALRDRALKMLEKDHFQKPELASVCQRLSESPAPDCEKLLRAAIERHAHHDVQGLAGYALAVSLARQAETAQQTGSAGADDLFRAAETQLDKVAKDYADVPCGRTNLGEVAQAKLAAVRHLSIGRPPLDIAGPDLDGQPMKLGELRGKVVVLAFWADWCGYSRQMYALERALVERHKDRPFALVGVNCDDDKEQARKAIQKGRINWRNWFDGDKSGRDRISAIWQVDHFPTIYVLDKKGIIRHKELRGNDLEAAVEALLKEE